MNPHDLLSQQILSLLCLPFHHTPNDFFIKATPRFELGIEDLQSTALPLGHIAFNFILINITLFIKTSQVFNIKFKIKQKKNRRSKTSYFSLPKLDRLITLQLQEQLELLVETHQLLDLEGSCERYARALLPYLGLNGLGYPPKC